MRLQYKMRAGARAAKLEAADVRELGRLNYRFLIQRRTRGIDTKNGKHVPWVDRRFHAANDALKQNKKTPHRRSNPRTRLRRILLLGRTVNKGKKGEGRGALRKLPLISPPAQI